MPTQPDQPQPEEKEPTHEEFLGNVKTLWDAWKKDGRAGLEKALGDLEE